jgi:uncharacterized RDD family membrane protein YckC
VSDRTTAISPEEEQHVFCDKLAVAYHLTVESFTHDLEKIAEMEPDERILGLEAFHESFGRNAVDFVSNLAQAVASTVRAETHLPEIRGTTTSSLSQELLAEAYKEVVGELLVQAQQSSEVAAYLAANSAVADSIGGVHATKAAAVGGAIDGALTGALFGRTTTGALVGAFNAFSERRHQIVGNKFDKIMLSSERITILDRTLRDFLIALDGNAEKLFDWAATKTFGSLVNLEGVQRACIAGNRSISSHIIPRLEKLSLQRAMNEQYQLLKEREQVPKSQVRNSNQSPAIPSPIPKYAAFSMRLCAALIDAVVLSIPQALIDTAISPTTSHEHDSVPWILSLVLQWLYFAWLESSPWQATLGKKILGLRVSDLAGRRISFCRASGRFFAKLVSLISLCIGFLMIAFTEKKQGLHDMLAGTIVTKSG